MRSWSIVLLLVSGCAGVTGFSDSNIPEKGWKLWVDPKAQGGLDHPLVSTLNMSGFCCVPLEPYNSTVRQFEIIGKRQAMGSGGQRRDLFDIKFDDGYGEGMTQRAFIRQSDMKLFPLDDPRKGHADISQQAKTPTSNTTSRISDSLAASPANIVTTADPIDKTTWYRDARTPEGEAYSFFVYFGKQNSGKPWLRFKTMYVGSSWVFAHSLIVVADGTRFDFPNLPFERRPSYVATEWVDIPVDTKVLQMIRAVADSKSAILRYRGQHDWDREIETEEKAALKNVLNAFVAGGGTLASR